MVVQVLCLVRWDLGALKPPLLCLKTCKSRRSHMFSEKLHHVKRLLNNLILYGIYTCSFSPCSCHRPPSSQVLFPSTVELGIEQWFVDLPHSASVFFGHPLDPAALACPSLKSSHHSLCHILLHSFRHTNLFHGSSQTF